jgi:putative membrane protein
MVLLAVVVTAYAWSAVHPARWGAWFMETVWVLAGVILVVVAWRRFPLTTLLCCVLAAWALVLAYGGHYTYAQTPAGNWAVDTFGLDRNPFDRLGHFMQGFVPAIAVREVLWRLSPLRGSRWLGPLTVCVCLAFSAFWELMEWGGAYLTEGGDVSFLGAQGDPWDTQWDMGLALAGALLALLALSRPHDRQLARLFRAPVGVGRGGEG